jgi:chromosomal replication initiation ATPase DnaA
MALDQNSTDQLGLKQSPRNDGATPLISIVASALSVSPDEIRSARRGSKRAALARQIAMYLVHTRLGLSFSAAGLMFGRDRTTAAHACRVIEDKRENADIDAIVDCLERAVDGRAFALQTRFGIEPRD